MATADFNIRLPGPWLRQVARRCKFLWQRLAYLPLYALRKRRLRRFGFAPQTPLRAVSLRLNPGCGCGGKGPFVPAAEAILAAFGRPGGGSAPARRFSQTAAAIMLDDFPAFEAWRVVTSRLTSGKYHRSASKARRLGYTSRLIGEKSYAASLRTLTASKPVRSKGLFVLAALTPAPSAFADSLAPFAPPRCPSHWRLAWGAFRADADGERLIAYAKLLRAGDLICVQSFIGHGEALTGGVTKMLMFDIMSWLLERRDPLVAGARALLHGSVEEGANGLFEWKRYMGFKPLRFAIVDLHDRARALP